MPSFRTTRSVGHCASDMFDLVADVKAYPQFLPLCQGMRIRKESVDAQGRPVIVAEMIAGYRAIRETFTTKVTLDRPALKIIVEYIDGPFKRLENIWTFCDTAPAPGERCDVGFFIDYEFRSRTLGLLVGSMFDTAFRKFSEAFEKRADEKKAVLSNVAAGP